MSRLLLASIAVALSVWTGLPFSHAAGAQPAPASRVQQPPDAPVTRFAVIGDMGNGSRRQRETAQQMWAQHARVPYEFVITVGDNMYGGQSPRDYVRKFETPYRLQLDAGIRFFAAIGNHDKVDQVNYAPFNMNGQRYYTHRHGPVEFFALDTVRLDQAQLRWVEEQLAASDAPWKIAHFHHPIYSSGYRHGPNLGARSALEPILATGGVRVVFTGHEHFYERLQPHYGIQSFISGSGGQLRKGGLRKNAPQTAAGNDQDNVFMLIEIEGSTLRFEAVSRMGDIVDSGTVELR